MTRDSLKDLAWFDQWVAFDQQTIAEALTVRKGAVRNKQYEPQFVYRLSTRYFELMLRRYSRGDALRELAPYFGPMLDAWEEAERLGKSIWTGEDQAMRHSWKSNLDFYIGCFWRVGIAMALEVPDSQWQRLVRLIGNEGEDAMLDRVIATRHPGRSIGTQLCHPMPYRRLLEAIEAPAPDRPALLKSFVTHWYAELDRLPKKGLSRETAIYDRPHWYGYHDVQGAYFGYWCIEAVAVAKAFGIDDHSCLGLPHYPGDLLRADGPSTHKEMTPASQREAVDAVTIKPTLGDRVRKVLFAPKA